jgi:hypothetical protein
LRYFRLSAKKKKEENKRTQTEQARDEIVAPPPVSGSDSHNDARTVIRF